MDDDALVRFAAYAIGVLLAAENPANVPAGATLQDLVARLLSAAEAAGVDLELFSATVHLTTALRARPDGSGPPSEPGQSGA